MTSERPALGEGWTLWRHAIVRGAGFPFGTVDEVLRAPDVPAAILKTAADARFREAVTWQNRLAVETGFNALLRRPPSTENAKTRQQQLLVVKYLQRYCAKNDTIGFFGPAGWTGVGGAAHFEAGPELIAERATYFEPWAILAMAQSCGLRSKLRAPVSRPGHLRWERGRLIGPVHELNLNALERKMVLAAKGQSARSLIEQLEEADAGADWLTILRRLSGEGLLRWSFPVAVSLQPERKWLRIFATRGLRALLAKRDEVAMAAGNAVRLGRALQDMETEFERRTGVPAWRHAGQMHSGRGLVYEECRRNISMDLGMAPLAAIRSELRAVLRIARWFTFQAAAGIAVKLREAHRSTRLRRVPLHVFWNATREIFEHETPPLIRVAASRTRERWEEIWRRAEPREDGQYLDVLNAHIAIGRAFDAPCPGWPGARHHAPDIMWSAPSPEALLAGRGTAVLSELHPGVTPFTTLSVLSLCPVVNQLRAEWDLDFPESQVSPIPAEIFARSTHDPRLAARHWHFDIGAEYVSERDSHQVLRAADYDVVNHRGVLLAIPRRGRGPEFDLLQVFERRIKLRAATAFSLAGDAPSGMRRYLGALMIQRRQWRISSLSFLATREGRAERVRAWQKELALPDRVFVRSPIEVKPIYIDLASPISVELLVRFARPAEYVDITEMYPGPEGLWLADGTGKVYTSELRFIAVDPESFASTKVWCAGSRLAKPNSRQA